jgi:phage tail-like protein
MAEFTVNASRVDPYKNFKFRVKWDGRVVAGVSKVSALKRTSEVIEFRNGANVGLDHRSPGRTSFEPITLERGVTHDTAFEDWANQVWRLGGSPEIALASFRKDIVIELLNEAGQVVIAYKVHRCWVSEYVAMADLDANATAVLIQSIKLEHEGWERDVTVTEPSEPS